MNLDFSGRTALVTGAAHGFGRAISTAFAARGARVWACDVLEDELRETESLCRQAGGSCSAVITDVRDPPPSTRASPRPPPRRAGWTSL